MKCLDCGSDLMAVGGIPTVWQCNTCTGKRVLEHARNPEVRFIGDTKATIRRL